MSAYEGTVILTGMISPTDTTDQYPTHEDTLGKGGHRTVELYADLDKIPELRKKLGMTVYVKADKNIYILLETGWLKQTSYLGQQLAIDKATNWTYAPLGAADVTNWLLQADTALRSLKSCYGATAVAPSVDPGLGV